MKKVFIKYNPYKLETEITVEGKAPAHNSQLTEKAAPGNGLQEWIEELPKILRNEYDDDSFEITFHGIMLDYDDIAEIFNRALELGIISNVELKWIPAKETADKEKLIEAVFDEIIHGPFEELRSEDIKKDFALAQSEDLEVYFVSANGAGKSTLINSMLGINLMPTRQEACTATLVRIRNNKRCDWNALAYDIEGNLVGFYPAIDGNTMNGLNSDPNVSTIKVNGNIPFVQSDDVSLVLIDTPGPNNSRDPEHGKIQRRLLGSSSESLVLYIMTGTFGNDDDNTLLKRVADSMKVNGKLSKDRLIFVVNKMDDMCFGDDTTEDILQYIKEFLKTHYGIINSNVFPAAALPALNIQLMKKSAGLDEDTIDETEFSVRKLNRNEQRHFDKFAPLPLSVKGQIKDQLTKAENDNDKEQQALIHTGVPSIEAAICQYYNHYVRPRRIKSTVDTLMLHVDASGVIEKCKTKISEMIMQADSDEALRMIHEIEAKYEWINYIRNRLNEILEI